MLSDCIIELYKKLIRRRISRSLASSYESYSPCTHSTLSPYLVMCTPSPYLLIRPAQALADLLAFLYGLNIQQFISYERPILYPAPSFPHLSLCLSSDFSVYFLQNLPTHSQWPIRKFGLRTATPTSPTGHRMYSVKYGTRTRPCK